MTVMVQIRDIGDLFFSNIYPCIPKHFKLKVKGNDFQIGQYFEIGQWLC